MSEHTTLDATTGAPLGEISQAPPAMEVFLDKHQMKLIALAGILVVCAIAYVIFKGVKQSHEETAGEMLVRADEISELQTVVNEHGDTAAAFSAKLLIAQKQWDEGQQDDAINTLKTFVETDRNHPARPSAEASLASKLWTQGKTDEAIKYFQDLTEDPDSRFLAPYAWISLGDIELSRGNVEKAEKSYERVEQDFPASNFSQQAMNRRLLAKSKAPVEVVAPIEVPEVKLGDDSDLSPAAGEDSGGDLLKAMQGAIGGGESNPLLLEEDAPQPTE